MNTKQMWKNEVAEMMMGAGWTLDKLETIWTSKFGERITDRYAADHYYETNQLPFAISPASDYYFDYGYKMQEAGWSMVEGGTWKLSGKTSTVTDSEARNHYLVTGDAPAPF